MLCVVEVQLPTCLSYFSLMHSLGYQYNKSGGVDDIMFHAGDPMIEGKRIFKQLLFTTYKAPSYDRGW